MPVRLQVQRNNTIILLQVRHYIKDISGNWAQITDKSATGFTVEIGALFFPGKHFWANIGISTTAFRYFEPQLAFGFSF